MPAVAACGTPILIGPRTWSANRTRTGERVYKLKSRVQVARTEGPQVALTTPGLPVPGSAWLVDDDFDQWAFCTQEATITPVEAEGQPNEFFDIENVFSTEPVVLCPDDSGNFDDPLLKADIVQGQFIRYTEEAVADRFNEAITTSSFEQIRGPQVEFDANRIQVRVTQNVADLNLADLSTLIDSVNLFPMWGFPARTVKFSGCEYAKHYYTDCSVYFTRVLEFDIDKNGFDRNLLDEGTKVLNGRWNRATGEYEVLPIGVTSASMNRTTGSPTLVLGTGSLDNVMVGQTVSGDGIPDDTTVLAVAAPNVTLSDNALSTGTGTVTFTTEADPENPHHFIRFKDRNGENARVILNGSGVPATRIDSGRIADVEASPLWYTVTTTTAHGLSNGDVIVIQGVLGTVGLNGQQEVLSVLDATSFLVSNPTEEESDYLGGGGWVTGPGAGPGSIRVEKYPSADLFQLGIPANID